MPEKLDIKSLLGSTDNVSLELARDIFNLEQTYGLYQQGKVKKKVFDLLLQDVLKKKKAEDTKKNSKGINWKALKNMANNVSTRAMQNATRFRPGNNQTQTAANGNSNINHTQSQRFSARSGRFTSDGTKQSSSDHPGTSEDTKIIMEDELLRLGKSKVGKAKWRKVFVQLSDTALIYYKKKGDPKPQRKIDLDGDYFVSEVRGGMLRRADSSRGGSNDYEDEDKMSIMSTQSEDIMDQPHLFLVSNFNTKFYFAAEDEAKKQYWVMMLTTIIRGLLHRATIKESVASPVDAIVITHNDNRSPEQIQADLEARKLAYVQSQMKKARPGVVGMSADEINAEEQKFLRQGERIARESIAIDFLAGEKRRAQQDVGEQEKLRRELRDKELAMKQLQEKLEYNEEQWQKKYDELLAKYREEARVRHENRLIEAQEMEDKIKKLRRMSVMPTGGGGRDYEAEIEMYKTKLKALQSALNVNLDSLDWDGTLEDAEAKMKGLMEALMAGDPKAQEKFDQYDQIIRNHKDYIERENKKWDEWERNNFEKNRDALNEMRKIATRKYYEGCSQQELEDETGIAEKTAARILKNNIFKFFWMDQDSIAKIHVADLLNRYAPQGLDLREMRAVYATLPKEFQMDGDGRKKRFRDNIRNRLFELTTKEQDGTIPEKERLNNAYRDNEIDNRPPKPKPIEGGPPPKIKIAGGGGDLKNKAKLLEGLLNKRGNGPPMALKPPPTENAAALKEVKQEEKLDPNDAKWAKYFRMGKAGLPPGAIMNGMQKDGLDPSVWFKLVELKEKGESSSAPSSTPAPVSQEATVSPPSTPPQEKSEATRGTEIMKEALNPNPLPKIRKSVPKPPENGDIGAHARKMLAAAGAEPSESFGLGGGNEEVRKKKKKKHKSKRNTELLDEDHVGAEEATALLNERKTSKTKKTLRRKTGAEHRKTEPGHVFLGDTANLLARVQLDDDTGGVQRGSRVHLDFNYPSAAKKHSKTAIEPQDMTMSQQRAGKMGNKLEEALSELIDIILKEGQQDAAEGGVSTIKFADLFTRYEKISDMLVGLLLKGKRQGKLKYRGDMLFKGIHDDIKITVL